MLDPIEHDLLIKPRLSAYRGKEITALFGLLFVLQIKKNKYTNKKWSFCNVYPCIGPKKSPFLQNKYTKDGCKGKSPSHRRKTVFYVCACLCIYGFPKRDKYLAFCSCYKKNNESTNKKWSFCNVYLCIRAKKSPFLQNKYTKDGCEGK